MKERVSKAFTREEGAETAGLGRHPPRVRSGEVRYVTPEGYAALRGELDELRARHSALLRLPDSERVALPDLTRRIALVEGTLSALTVLGPDAAPEGEVAFATFVTVTDGDGRVLTWRIVGPDESDPKLGLLSVHAPLARALLGHRAGDAVVFEHPAGERRYLIAGVRRKVT